MYLFYQSSKFVTNIFEKQNKNKKPHTHNPDKMIVDFDIKQGHTVN